MRNQDNNQPTSRSSIDLLFWVRWILSLTIKVSVLFIIYQGAFDSIVFWMKLSWIVGDHIYQLFRHFRKGNQQE